jgi:hypothetical protein
MSDKYTNTFADGEVTGKNPDADDDRYSVIDRQLDHNYWQSKIADMIKQISLNPTKDFQILYGGVVTDSGSGQVDISAGVAVGKDASGNVRLVTIPALTNISLPTGWNDNRQIWVVGKYDYKYDTPTRQHFNGDTYKYILEDSYVGNSDSDNLFVDSDPGDTVVIWGSFKMNGTTFTNFSVGERTRNANKKPNKSQTILTSSYHELPPVAHFDDLIIDASGSVVISTKVLIVEGDLFIGSSSALGIANYEFLYQQAAVGGNSLDEIMAQAKASGGYGAGGFGGYSGAVDTGGGGYTTSGGGTNSGATPGGGPYIDISKFGISTGIGGNGGDGSGSGTGGGGGLCGSGAFANNRGGAAVLIIVKGNFINNAASLGLYIHASSANYAQSTAYAGGGGIFLVAYGENNIMGKIEARGSGSGGSHGGGGGGHIATLRASGSAPITNVSGGAAGGTGVSGSAGTVLNLDLRTNPEYGLTNWGSTDAGILTANFIYQVFGHGWSVYV